MKMKKLLVLIICATGIVFLEANPAEPATLEVRAPGGMGTLDGGTVYTSIQQAIDDADPFDIIEVAAGTYDMNTVGPDWHLIIETANLTLKSEEGKDNTIINVRNGVGIDIRAGADNFVLGGEAGHGFTIAGGTDTSFVIQLTNAPSGVEISHNTIDTTGNASMGVSVGAAGAADLTISNNDFVAEDGDGSIWGPDVHNVTVSDNTFTGPATPTSGYAIQFAGVTSASPSTINGNTIDNYGSGIFIHTAGGTTVVSGLTINDNSISECLKGIRLGHSSQTLDMDDVTVTGNTLSDNTVGLYVDDATSIKADQFTVQYNKFMGDNTSYGLQNANATYVVTATHNWWGDVTGPYHSSNPDGQGDPVSDNVIFEPWYCDEAMLDRVTVKIGATENVRAYSNTIQAGIDAAHEGDTVVAEAGTYPEYLHITTDNLTIQGAGIDQSIIDFDGLLPYWHYSPNKSFASRAGVLITGYGSPDSIIEGVTFTGFTVKNAGLNPPITASGQADAADPTGTVLTDSTASFPIDGSLVGQWLHNVSDKEIKVNISGNAPIRSYGQITANTATTVTAILAGGYENDWDIGETYVVTPYEEYVDRDEDLQDDVPGLTIGNGKDVIISYCKVVDNGSGGIGAGKARLGGLYSEGITIDHCIVSDNPGDGINIGAYVGAVTITNNTCSNNGSPHPTDPSREYGGKGIEVSGLNSGQPISGVISDNICANNKFEGIVLKNYSDGVTIEKNTVTGSNFDEDGAGIFFYGKSSTPSNCDNHDVNDNTVTGNIRGIVAYYAQYCTIQGNTITTDSGAFALGQGGIKLDGANNMLVQNNILSSLAGIGIKVQNTWNDVESFDNTIMGNTITGAQFAGIPIWGGAHDNTFTDNTITGTTELTFWAGESYEEIQADGVFIDDDAGTGNVFNCNKIYDNDGDGMENQVTTFVDAENNWWGDSSGPNGVGGGSGDEVSDYVDFFPWLLSSEDCDNPTEVVTDFVVDDDWALEVPFTQVFVNSTAYYIGLNAFAVIQDAVVAASDGNSIKVADGNYVGAIVNEDLDIIGANPGGSVITSGVPYKDGSSLETAFRLDADADGAEIKNFTIDCNAADNFYFAIFSRAANDVVVDSLTVNDPVQGITNYGGSNWQITNNLLNYTEAAGGGGIAIYLGAYPPDYVVLHDNIVKGNAIVASATAPDFTCPGICMALDLRYGRYDLLTGNEDISYNMIVNNDITGTGAASEVGIEIGVIGLESDPNKIAATLGLIHDNLVRNNIIENTDWGIYFYTVSDLMVLGNEMVDCNDGIHIKDSHKGTIINYNAIYGSASYGLNNTGSVVVDATFNWWGDVSGPNDPDGTSDTDGVTCYEVSEMKNDDGLGDVVTQNADYCPWLTAPVSPSDGPYTVGDLNGDGCVDWRDFAIFALNWLEGCE